ncbi:MAG TPA: hypothetical protein VIX89_16165 [Bryobacteraceae bacterium]
MAIAVTPGKRAVRSIWVALLVCRCIPSFSGEPSGPLVYLFTLAPRYEPHAWMEGGERFPAGATVYLASGKQRERRLIAADFSASADAAVSYDGARVLFAGKVAPAAPWQIWETTLGGGTPRRITSGDTDCFRPLYLPDGGVVYTRRLERGTVLELARPGVAKVERLTFAPGKYLTDTVLQDGRILIEAVEENSGGNKRELFTLYPDGTGLESLRCDHGHDRAEGRQMSTGDVIFEERGRLASIRAALASQTDVIQPKVRQLGPVAEVGPDRWLLTVQRPGNSHAGIFLWNVSSRRLLSLENPQNASAVQPVMAAPRTPPRDFPSALTGSRRGANALCLNTRQSLAPYQGVAQWVRVYGQGPRGEPVILGRAEVAGDGSFFVQVPGDRPIRFELLDGEGRSLRSEQNWIWFRSGEQRICAGCHAGPEQAAENRLPDVLRGRPSPASLTGSAANPKPE